ncbi:hypothetical protein F511_29238 [Dorcoceras hygrometricum]|uniref:Uncharacterized protein n=1 Tax=Dorcoceras hygrometricum TaxID=472368 RepID=A0A2Z7B429_9LAMI|nr:hypothetical protein F511_29238 [Dorcoceras hygrometricum]
MVFFKETQTVTYESRALFIEEFIKRLAAGDTPDAPYYHLGTREPNRSPQGRSAHQQLECRTETKPHATHLTYVVKIGSWPEDSLPVRGYFPSLLSRPYFSRTLPDLGIGGAKLDTLPTPSDLVFVAAAQAELIKEQQCTGSVKQFTTPKAEPMVAESTRTSAQITYPQKRKLCWLDDSDSRDVKSTAKSHRVSAPVARAEQMNTLVTAMLAKIRDVDWRKRSMPKIAPADKGKKVLYEKAKGNPV